jgi:hypothetical protein
MFLADELIERPRPHPRRQRLGPPPLFGPLFAKEIDRAPVRLFRLGNPEIVRSGQMFHY